MIISQTPYRVSLVGGGTDLPAFYQREFGAVLSMTIKRHMYVTVHRRFEQNIRVAYSQVDFAENVAGLHHELVREAMRMVGVDEPLEITTIGDVPGGTGMGSSSTLTVGVLAALYAHSGQVVGRRRLAREACQIEIDILGKPIGKQDQYAAAFGGINYIQFNSDESVDVQPVPVKREVVAELESRALLLYTSNRRSADEILSKQSAGTADKMTVLRQMRDLTEPLRQALCGGGGVDEVARILHEGWLLKRSLGFGISAARIDQWYETARELGAQGGKLLGAGGGGFLFLLAPPERHEAIREALGRPQELPFVVDHCGGRIIYVSDLH